MNNINLFIGGNLTGFSRFYASSAAGDLYAMSKFDLDYRNYVTFLSEEDKSYGIAFSSNVIAVSLVTRILDSFRRPGVLVVSILLHRNETIVSADDSGDKEAIYTLLNRVNARFYEKNFLSGMLNQNASVLMQDYYEDILQDYVVVSDPNQRRINTTVDWETPNKRIGYVKGEESSMPLYLSSLCRRSYTGYHFIIFSPKALPNIEEDPIEAVLYNVYVQNTRQNIHAVKLTDKIPANVRPGMGEKPCPVDYTYQQVIAGEAGHHIMALIKGEEIELNFNFEQEEKTVEFKFIMDGGSIPFETICPVCEIDATSIQISSPRFTFRGKEIYGTKILKSGNPGFIIKPESEALDISRISDGDVCLIQVEHCTTWTIDFKVFNQPKKITLRNMKSGKILNSPNVTRIFSASIPGNWEDWQILITSDYYEPITQMLPRTGEEIKLNFVPRRNEVVTPIVPVGNGGNSEIIGSKTPQKIRKKKKYSVFPYLWCALAAIFVLIVGCCTPSAVDFIKNKILSISSNGIPSNGIPSNEQSVIVEKNLTLKFFDNSGDIIKCGKDSEKNELDKSLLSFFFEKFIIELTDGLSFENFQFDSAPSSNQFIAKVSIKGYTSTASTDDNIQLGFILNIDKKNYNLKYIDTLKTDLKRSFKNLDEDCSVNVKIPILCSEIDEYCILINHLEADKKNNPISQDEKNTRTKRLNRIKKAQNRNLSFDKFLDDLFGKVPWPTKDENQPAKVESSKTNSDESLNNVQLKNKWTSLTTEDLKNIISDSCSKGSADYVRAQAMIEALKSFMLFVTEGKALPEENPNLNEDQNLIIREASSLIDKGQMENLKKELRFNCYEKDSRKEKYSFGNVRLAISETQKNIN